MGQKEGSGSCLVACPAEGAPGAAQPATRFLTRHLPVFQADFLKGLPVSVVYAAQEGLCASERHMWSSGYSELAQESWLQQCNHRTDVCLPLTHSGFTSQY